MDWANFALFAVAYLCRFRALTQASELIAAEGFPPTDQAYISYEDPAFWIMMWKNILAFNCIITWVKMLKHLGHVPVMTHIIKVMAHCLPGVLNFLFVFIFIFVGSAMAHLLAYGDSTYRFKDLPMSMYRYRHERAVSCKFFNTRALMYCIPGCSMYRSLFGDFDFMEMFLGWDLSCLQASMQAHTLFQQSHHRSCLLYYLDFDWVGGAVQHVRRHSLPSILSFGLLTGFKHVCCHHHGKL